MIRLLAIVLAGVIASLLVLGGDAVQAQEPEEETLVRVNLQGVASEIPTSIAVPTEVAAVACEVGAPSLSAQADPAVCAAETKTGALADAIAVAIAAGTQNNAAGLVNVGLQNLGLQRPDFVLLPSGAIGDICGENQPALQDTGEITCDAQTTSTALTDAIASALLGQ